MLPGMMMSPGFFSASGGPNIANLFATTLFTSTGSNQTITTGLDFTATGGLSWFKGRGTDDTRFETNHRLSDTIRTDAANFLKTNSTAGLDGTFQPVNSWSSTGLQFNGAASVNGATHVLWSFVRAARFFDVVTWTGNASGLGGQSIPHSLGATPGMIIAKKTSGTGNWYVHHRGGPGTYPNYRLNTADSVFNLGNIYNVGSSSFFVYTDSFGGADSLNDSGSTYVAYLFAHDTASDGVVQCGSYTGNGSTTGPTVTLGWQPQFVLVKRSDGLGGWIMFDSVRGQSGSDDYYLLANASDPETTNSTIRIDYLSTGFQMAATATAINANGGTYLYVAIRAAG